MTDTEPRPTFERESLIRMSPVALRASDDGRTLIGYAAVFNEPTVIDSWEGKFIEQIVPGAFRSTLRNNSDQIKVLFNHGMDPAIGDKPLGKATVMKEDDRGLYVEVPLDRTSYNEDLIALLRSGALDGMSFRMTVLREDWADPDDPESGELPTRTIKEIRLYEFGPVTFPAYAATQAGVRAHAPAAYEAWRAMSLKPEAGGVLVPGKTIDPPGPGDADSPAADPGTGEPPTDDAADPGTSSTPTRATRRKRNADALASMHRAMQVTTGL